MLIIGFHNSGQIFRKETQRKVAETQSEISVKIGGHPHFREAQISFIAEVVVFFPQPYRTLTRRSA